VISHRPVGLSCSHHSLMEKRTLCATFGSRELNAKPFRRSLRDRAAISVYVRVACDRRLPLLQLQANLTSFNLLARFLLSIPPVKFLYCATLAPQQQT